MIKVRNPKIDRNSNDFREVSNTNLKPATCSKCRACQQKQGFGHLRSRSTIAIKSRSNFVEKLVIFIELGASLIDRNSSNFGEAQFDRISTNTNFHRTSNAKLKPATCSKYRACQQKQGFGHLRSRSTIAIKSRSNFIKKTAILMEA